MISFGVQVDEYKNTKKGKADFGTQTYTVREFG